MQWKVGIELNEKGKGQNGRKSEGKRRKIKEGRRPEEVDNIVVICESTICRSQALGIASFAGRVSSLLAPFTSLVVRHSLRFVTQVHDNTLEQQPLLKVVRNNKLSYTPF